MSSPRKTEKQRTSLDVQICKIIRESSMTLNAVAVAAGVPQPVLFRFFNGEQQSIVLQNAEKLCAFFDVQLTSTKRRKQAQAAKGES